MVGEQRRRGEARRGGAGRMRVGVWKGRSVCLFGDCEGKGDILGRGGGEVRGRQREEVVGVERVGLAWSNFVCGMMMM